MDEIPKEPSATELPVSTKLEIVALRLALIWSLCSLIVVCGFGLVFVHSKTIDFRLFSLIKSVVGY